MRDTSTGEYHYCSRTPIDRYEAIQALKDIRVAVIIAFNTTKQAEIEDILDRIGYPVGGEKQFIEHLNEVRDEYARNNHDWSKCTIRYGYGAKKRKTYRIGAEYPSGHTWTISEEGALIIWKAYASQYSGQTMERREERGCIAYREEIDIWKKAGLLPKDFDWTKYIVNP